MNKENQISFQPNVVKIIISLLFIFATGIFLILVYFIIDPKTYILLRISGSLIGIGLLSYFVCGIIFTPALIKIDNSTISFKRLLRSSFVEISQNAINKIEICWRRSHSKLSGSWYLYSIKIYTSERGVNKSYYLFTRIYWTFLKDGDELLKKLRQMSPDHQLAQNKRFQLFEYF